MTDKFIPWITGKAPTSLVGAAGEHYGMTHLLLRGCLAAVTPRGAPDADILVGTSDGSILAGVQVKARSGRGGKGWRMSEKHEHIIRDRLFYCFVDFGHGRDWPVYLMPSSVVAKYLGDAHAAYLANPGRHGQQRKDWSGRFVSPHLPRKGWMEEYRERWDLLLGQPGTGPARAAAVAGGPGPDSRDCRSRQRLAIRRLPCVTG